ncbi:hypothetical protein BD289DRAFT_435449 [Coniella lustricola]|uniref:Uncharacterized protein n=1 Tax=Coniella lustricola TaxID=2025994 RepID=A0A2T3A6N5_9PEZI|nr:hypothetical protein BD289DRAFT_435449 [Coniella lustricola]
MPKLQSFIRITNVLGQCHPLTLEHARRDEKSKHYLNASCRRYYPPSAFVSSHCLTWHCMAWEKAMVVVAFQ